MGKLTALSAKSVVAKGKPGAHADGGNLYLRVAGPGAGKWTFRYMLAGRSREMGLGAYDADGKAGLTLAQAREAAGHARAVLGKGLDPLEHRKVEAEAQARAEAERQAKARTVRDVAEHHLCAHEAGWRNAKHRAQWRTTLERYVYPVLGGTPVGEVGTDEVLRALHPIWTEKPETASRVRGRMEAVLDHAAARGWRTGENPARWKGHLANLLPARGKLARVEHHAALPWAETGAFMAALAQQDGTAALALRFTILTAARTGEVIGARWGEIDLDAKVWTVPGARMKAGREHRVPLSGAAMAVLRAVCPPEGAAPEAFVFPGGVKGKGLSNMGMAAVLRRMRRADLTVHGFRSTFRDWAEEATSTPHAVSEAALAHSIGDKVEAAYRRGDLFAKRRALMEEWADYCAKAPAEVVALAERRA